MKTLNWRLMAFVAFGLEATAQENQVAPVNPPVKPAQAPPGGTADPAIYLMEFRVLGFRSDDATFEFPGGDSERGELTDQEFDSLVSQEAVTVISAPQVTTLGGRQAQVSVSQVAPQYFEPEGAGYVLKTLAPEDSPGLLIDTLIDVSSNDHESTARLGLTARMTIVKGREELPGVQLDVGRPILENRQVEASLDVSLGEWVYLKSSEFETKNRLNINAFIVLVRAYRTDGRGNVERTVERDLVESLDLKATTVEKSADGRVIRARGDVSFRLPHGWFGDSNGELELSGYLGRSSEVEIRRVEENRELGFRANRIDTDPEFGGFILEGNAHIEYDQVSIRSDRVSLFPETTIQIGVDAEGKIEVNGEPVAVEALERALQDAGADKATPVVIQADQRADWDLVSDVVRTLKRVGVARLSVTAIGAD